MTILFRDTFQGTGLPDPAHWNVKDLSNNWAPEAQEAFIDAPRFVSQGPDGLTINALLEPNYSKPYTSGRINSFGKHEFTYGHFEALIACSKHPCVWPSFWLGDFPSFPWIQPANKPPVGGGELDLIESGLQGVDGVTQTYITNIYSGIPRFYQALDITQYHLYALDWHEDKLQFSIDEQATLLIEKSKIPVWPFNHNFGLELGLGIRGIMPSPQWIKVKHVEVRDLVVSIPAPGPIPVPQPLPTPPPGGTMQLTATLQGRVLTFSATGTELHSGAGFHHVEVSKPASMGGGWHHLMSSPFTLPPGLDTVTVRLVENSTLAEHPLVPGQSYVLTVGTVPPPPVTPPPVTPPSAQVFTCKYSRLMNFVGEVTATTQAEADARYKEYVDKTYFTAKPI